MHPSVVPSRPTPRPHRPSAIGDLVYWLRSPGSGVKPERLQTSPDWHGPAILVCLEGAFRAYVSYFGTTVLVHPEQLRRASQDELALADLEFDATDVTSDLVTFPRRRQTQEQIGFVDHRGSTSGDVSGQSRGWTASAEPI